MSSRFILPFADVGSGIKPSSGAKLFFFETDGTTPKNTFSDQLSTPTANTNPVIANSNGVFGDIFITGEYKVTLQDKNGSQIFGLASIDEFVTSASQSDENFISIKTKQEAIDETKAEVGDYVRLSDRDNALFQYFSGQTANGNNIIEAIGSGFQLVLEVKGSIKTKAWGIVGDNSTDDTASWLALGVYTETNDVVIIGNPDDEYKVTSDIVVKSSLNFEANGATFKPVASNGLVVGKTQVGTSTTASVDIAIYTDNITVVSAASFAVGDLVEVKSTLAWMLDPSPTEDLKKGEFNKINRIATNVIYFEKLISDNYLVGSETITLTKIDKIKVNITNLNVDFGASEPRLGIEVRGDDGGKIKGCTVNRAQIQGMNIINCYKTRVLNCNAHESNNTGTGYGIQINSSTDIKVYHSTFTGCRRGVDISGDIPSRGCDIAFNDADGSGLDSAGGNLPSNSGSSGFGSHETSEFNQFRNNKVSGCRYGVLLRGKDEVVKDNYFYTDILIACVQVTKAINFTVESNIYSAGMRPGKTLITADDQQKVPHFVSMTNPAVDGGFYKVINNVYDGLKQSFMVFTLTSGAPFFTLTNVTITGNHGKVTGPGTGTVLFLEQGDQVVTFEDSTIINNIVTEDITNLVMYDTGFIFDIENTVEIDNFQLDATHIINGGGGGTLSVTKHNLNLSVKDHEVVITGFIEFDITVNPVVLKLEGLPTKTILTGGTVGPAYSFPFIEGVTTSGVGASGMVAMPSGTSGSIPTSAWLSSTQTAYNDSWIVATGYKIPVSFRYFTERRVL